MKEIGKICYTACLLAARMGLAFAVMLWVTAQFVETVGIISTPWGEVAVANDARGVVVDGYGLSRRFEWVAIHTDTEPWTSDHLFEQGWLHVESLEFWNLNGAPWNIRFAAYHGLVVVCLLALNGLLMIPWRKLERACIAME